MAKKKKNEEKKISNCGGIKPSKLPKKGKA